MFIIYLYTVLSTTLDFKKAMDIYFCWTVHIFIILEKNYIQLTQVNFKAFPFVYTNDKNMNFILVFVPQWYKVFWVMICFETQLLQILWKISEFNKKTTLFSL